MFKYCVMCGKEIHEQAVMCPNCGHVVSKKSIKQINKLQMQNEKNEFTTYLKGLVFLQYFLLIVSFITSNLMIDSELLSIIAIIAVFMFVPCLILAILSLKRAAEFSTTNRRKTGVISLVLEIPIIAFFIYLCI